MSVSQEYAALSIMHFLAQQAELFGHWMDPEWREVWEELRQMAEVPVADRPRNNLELVREAS